MILRVLRWLYFTAVLVGATIALAIGTPLQDVLVRLVIYISAPLTWYATYRLWSLWGANRDLEVLRIQAVAVSALAVIATVFAVIFLNNGMEFPILDLIETQLVTRSVIFLMTSLPAAYWLWLYRKEPPE